MLVLVASAVFIIIVLFDPVVTSYVLVATSIVLFPARSTALALTFNSPLSSGFIKFILASPDVSTCFISIHSPVVFMYSKIIFATPTLSLALTTTSTFLPTLVSFSGSIPIITGGVISLDADTSTTSLYSPT